jgi:nucleotide-binding universal stress UspA family protein
VIENAHSRRLNYAQSLCAKARKQLEDSIANCIVHYDIKEGNVKTQIIDSAIGWSADKLILGAHGTNICPRFILGSVSRAVAAHAPCSVEIIRPGKKDARPHAVSSKGKSKADGAGQDSVAAT